MEIIYIWNNLNLIQLNLIQTKVEKQMQSLDKEQARNQNWNLPAAEAGAMKGEDVGGAEVGGKVPPLPAAK